MSKHLMLCQRNKPTLKNLKNDIGNYFQCFGSVSGGSSECSQNSKCKSLEKIRNTFLPDSGFVNVFEPIEEFMEILKSDSELINEFLEKENPDQGRLNEFINKLKHDQLRKCDIILCKCKGYFHWAMYIGDAKIFLNSHHRLRSHLHLLTALSYMAYSAPSCKSCLFSQEEVVQQQQSQSTQMNNLYSNGKPMHHFSNNNNSNNH